jgi:GTP-binding protein HflX
MSAVTGEGLDAVIRAVTAELDRDRTQEVLHLAHEDGRRRAWLYEQGVVEAETETDDGVELTVNWTPAQATRFSRL